MKVDEKERGENGGRESKRERGWIINPAGFLKREKRLDPSTTGGMGAAGGCPGRAEGGMCAPAEEW